MGAVGAAGAGAGIGTSALFNDTESFEDNQLTAGSLDLKMDWEEHYSFPQIYDDFGDPTTETDPDTEDEVPLDITRSDPNDSRYVGLPDPENPVVWANAQDDPLGDGQSSLELYFQNTTIEAFPDRLGGENPEATFTSIDSGGEPIVENPCDALADVPQDLSTFATDGMPARTQNGDTNDDGDGLPLLNLQDIKPGDFGEFTFSAHLCDNPGYLWMTMPGGLTESENGLTEPEDEVDDTPDEGELAENVQTALWYDDDCDNQIDTAPDDIVALAIIDTSGSVTPNLQQTIDAGNALAEDLFEASQNNPELEVQAGVITFEGKGDNNDVFLANPIEPIDNYVDNNGDGIFGSGDILPPGQTDGNSPIPQALDVGREYLNDKAAKLVSDGTLDAPVSKQLLLISDGNPVYDTSGNLDAVAGELIDENGQFTFDGNTYESDYFDGKANGSGLALPNPGNPPGAEDRAETALVARDIDGEPFLPGTQYSQPAGPKVDNPDNQPQGLNGSDPADISGDNDIIVRAAAVYDSGAGSGTKQLARDTITAYATSDATMYDIPTAGTGQKSGGTVVGEDIADALTAGGSGEEVIFRGTLEQLESELDPGLALDFDRTTSEQDCHPAGVTHCFGLAWWVPEDVGNEIQSDSVSFDLGFYTEQCRNNDNPTGP
ncbi:von Willebrand factor type A [Halorubrum saccharovorum DSM 1137]|uniref:von Willebrand factor type A n=2 Tax=Halorubrum saccharovorum TaxID=2248 RepID=M0E604_9EURY|nr:von Willebrand factor type A [Halorubrum saccharovorum DSM 1137]